MRKLFSLLLLAAVVSTANAFEFNRQPAGLIKGARQSYVSATAIKVGVGYGEIMGSYWEITSADALVTTGYTLTGLTTTTNGVVHYLYIDRANSSLPGVTLKNSTTAPAWSDDFMGWYNGVDRCIGAVWVKADGSLAQFLCSQDDTYHYDLAYFYEGTSITTSFAFTSFDGSPYMPVNAYEVNLGLLLNGTGTAWVNCKAGLLGDVSQGIASPFYESGSREAQLTAWIPFARGNKTFCFMPHASNSSGTAKMNMRGYRLER